MSLWNSLGSVGRRRPAGGRLSLPSDDPIYLTDQAARSRPSEQETRFPHVSSRDWRGLAGEEQERPARRTLSERLGLRRAPVAEEPAGPRRIVARPERPPAPPPAAPAWKPPRRKSERGDFALAALGLTLGLICALFPWYIFFNQDKFGVREFVFEGSRGTLDPSALAYQPQLVGTHFSIGDVPMLELDFIPTATVGGSDDPARAVPLSEQPFPSDLINFRLVHVANGRAMIEDEDGLWVVQPGSRLPDASQVASIEQRGGNWMLVTTHDRVVELEP